MNKCFGDISFGVLLIYGFVIGFIVGLIWDIFLKGFFF